MERTMDEQKVEKWQTVDGMKFDSKTEAMQWELNLGCVALKMIKGKFSRIPTDSDIERIGYAYLLSDGDLNAFIFEPKDEADIRNLLMYSETKGYYFTSNEKEIEVGEKYLFLVDNERDRSAIISPKILENKFKQETEVLNELFKD